MAISVVDTTNLEWHDVSDPGHGRVAGQPRVRYKYFATEMPSVPAGQLVRYEAGHADRLHSHEEDEVFIILEGSLVINDGEVPTGGLAFIGGGTTYAARTVNGCTYLRLRLGAG